MQTLIAEKTRIEQEVSRLGQLNQELLAVIADKDNQLREKETNLSELQVQATSTLNSTTPGTNVIFPQSQSSPKNRITPSVVESFINWEEGQSGNKASPSDWWGSGFDETLPEVVEEPIQKKRPFLTNESGSEDEKVQNEVHRLEVQLTELQINLDEAKSQVDNLNSTLEAVSWENSRLQDENLQLKREAQVLKEKVNLSLTPSPDQTHESSPTLTSGQGKDEATLSQLEEAESVKKNLTQEVRELKVRNAKTIQKFKQLKEKYDALLKTNEKKEFSLESTMEDELLSQVKQQNESIEENLKIIHELRGEKESLSQKVDIIERANDQLIQMKESQERYIQQLVSEVKQLQQEISGLKWRLEEVENMASSGQSEETSFGTYNEDSNQLRQQNMIASQEIQHLQQQNASLMATVEQLNAKNQQLSMSNPNPVVQAQLVKSHDTVDTNTNVTTSSPANVATPGDEITSNLQTLQEGC